MKLAALVFALSVASCAAKFGPVPGYAGETAGWDVVQTPPECQYSNQRVCTMFETSTETCHFCAGKPKHPQPCCRY